MKITTHAVISWNQRLSIVVLAGFYQRANALCTQYFSYFPTFHVNCNSLQVRAKSSGCRLFRPGAVPTKGRCFSTLRTLSHLEDPFISNNSMPAEGDRSPSKIGFVLPEAG